LISTAFSLSWAALLRPLWLSKVGAGAVHPISWRKEYGGMRVDQAKRLKDLEKENARLKRLVADQALDLAILKDVASEKF
jgi:hypothetical protein